MGTSLISAIFGVGPATMLRPQLRPLETLWQQLRLIGIYPSILAHDVKLTKGERIGTMSLGGDLKNAVFFPLVNGNRWRIFIGKICETWR